MVQIYSPITSTRHESYHQWRLFREMWDLHKALICVILYVLLSNKWLIQIRADRAIFQSAATASTLSLTVFKSLLCCGFCYWKQYCSFSSAMRLIRASVCQIISPLSNPSHKAVVRRSWETRPSKPLGCIEILSHGSVGSRCYPFKNLRKFDYLVGSPFY